jgi:hypothetical protein
MQPRPGRFAEVPFLRNGHKIAQVSELHLPTSQASLAKLRSLCLTDDIGIANVDPDHPMSAGLQKEFGRKADPRRETGESICSSAVGHGGDFPSDLAPPKNG